MAKADKGKAAAPVKLKPRPPRRPDPQLMTTIERGQRIYKTKKIK